VLRDERVTSALIGASSVAQLEDSLGALDGAPFDDEELAEIDKYAKTRVEVDLWATSATL
jgi:L-glyceraldehyde 3-phosphate reductase